MTVGEILQTWLRQNGHDGLVNIAEPCGCGLDDLISCGGPCDTCQPAYAGPDPSGDCDVLFYATREAVQHANEQMAERPRDKAAGQEE